jgi:hypothetical protein
MIRFRVNLARLTGTATTRGAGGFVWFSSLLLSSLRRQAMKPILYTLLTLLSTGCVTRTIRFEYAGGKDGAHVLTVRTTSFFSNTSLERLQEDIQTSEFVSGSLAQGLITRPNEEALKAIVEGAVRAALSKP